MGYGRLDLAVVLAVVTFVTLRILTAYEASARRARMQMQAAGEEEQP